MTDDKPLQIWSEKARNTLHKKLSRLAIDWLSTVLEITEQERKKDKGG